MPDDSCPKLGPAKTLSDAYKTLGPKPLISPEELSAYYRASLNAFRGDDYVNRMELGLSRAWQGQHYKSFLMGHSGVGKSTELTRLLVLPLIKSRFRPIRLSVTEHLDPIAFKPFDVLLLMMHEVAQATVKPVAEGGVGKPLSDKLLREVLAWFATVKGSAEQTTAIAAQAEAGAGLNAEGLLGKLFGVFARVRGEMKYASTRKREVVEYNLSQLNSLIEAANALLGECNRLLTEADQREWLFVIEDFDKAGVSPRATEDFFVTYANAIRGLDCHLVFTLPIWLGYSSKAVQLPVAHDRVFCIPDTMVFSQDHTPHIGARNALREVLEARVQSNLFAEGQVERLIVASGGNLRDLFALTSATCDSAFLRKATQVQATDVDKSIRDLRTTYQRRLGDSPHDDAILSDGREWVTYDQKAELMVRIYRGDEAAKVPNPVLYSLLRSRALQEFNGERWFGVHPLVVDILGAQGKLERQSDGSCKGGTV